MNAAYSLVFHFFPVLLLMSGCERLNEKEICTEGDFFAPDHILQVGLTLEDSDWELLRNQSRSFITEFVGDCASVPFSGEYTYVPADVTIDGQALSNIGVRKKGFIGSQSTEKPSLKLNLDEYEAGAELFCTDNITLNNAVQDPSLVRQCIGYKLFSEAGIAAPLCNFAQVSVNGADLGTYVHVEPIKRSFLRRNFAEDNGELYEGTLSDFSALRYRTFDPKNTDSDPNLTAIAVFSEALDSPDPGAELE